MTIRLEIPFLPDPDYADFLETRSHFIHSLYFSLFKTPSIDARYRLGPWQRDELFCHLPRFRETPKYALINSRFYRPEQYFDRAFHGQLAEHLMALYEAGLLDGIVFSDFYFINAIGRHPCLNASGLEAVPSVNTHIDHPHKLQIYLDTIQQAGFRRPSQIILDRALNRQLPLLRDMVGAIRKRYPEMAIGLLANEGCLLHCPFKAAHDAHMALGNMRLIQENTYSLNADLGCMRVFRDWPERIFQSPFIRPEDVDQYANMVSYIKLGGRTLGTAFLKRAIRAYTNRRYEGNLLDLMDTLEALSTAFHVDAGHIPEDFYTRMTNCPENCQECRYCRRLARRTFKRRPLQLPDFRRQA